ncbi:hypothetical protein FB446DRAFT_320908 [Lentinula raphanica]|nr:hypothetical protein FB446DRAFT_320908 [Lentinula raphanica]
MTASRIRIVVVTLHLHAQDPDLMLYYVCEIHIVDLQIKRIQRGVPGLCCCIISLATVLNGFISSPIVVMITYTYLLRRVYTVILLKCGYRRDVASYTAISQGFELKFYNERLGILRFNNRRVTPTRSFSLRIRPSSSERPGGSGTQDYIPQSRFDTYNVSSRERITT